DQASIVLEDIEICSLPLPTDHIQRIGFVIAVVIAPFCPKEFLSGMDEGYSLCGKDCHRRQLVHGATIRIRHRRAIDRADQEPVPERMVVVAFDIVYRLEGTICEILNPAANTLLDRLNIVARLDESTRSPIKDVSLQCIAKVIVEDRPATPALLSFQCDLDRSRSPSPRLAVYQQVWVDRMKLSRCQFECLSINQPEKIESETIDFIL